MINNLDNGKSAVQNIDREEQIESCSEYLWNIVKDGVSDGTLVLLCSKVLCDHKFKQAYGSTTKHHNFKGGLIVHTSEVLEYALQMALSKTLDVNLDNLITAVIFHDYAKFADYELNDGAIEYTQHRVNISHLNKSYAIFYNMAMQHHVNEKTIDDIGHIILAHHGRLEWGSPVTPQNTEAFIIHFADMLSSRCAKDYYIRN